jgi:hypothetical protein
MTTRDKTVLDTFGPGSIHMVGDGFHVRNLFPSNELGEALSPFLLLDYAGPTFYPPGDRQCGVGEHPHRGFETVTIVYQGRVAHRDSAGNSGVIGPGDVQWMTAASGVVHEERHEPGFARAGGTLQMVQLWVNLPARHKRSPPRYQAIPAAQIPEVAPAEGATLRLRAAGRAGRRPRAVRDEHRPGDLPGHQGLPERAHGAPLLSQPPGRSGGVRRRCRSRAAKGPSGNT